ncbi:MAG: protoporphyrinogen oxidase [Gemmatimonadales bacterium]
MNGTIRARARAVVVGGGITGLTAAYRLTEELGRDAVLLLETSERLGGKIATELVDGFVIEGGPDCFLAAKPGGVELCRALGLGDRLTGTDPARKRSFVKRRGTLHELPEGITGLVPSRIWPLLTTGILSLPGRFRAGMEYFVPKRRDGADETIREFVARRFGIEAYDWLAEPLLGGIYAGNGAELSLRAIFPQLAEIERSQGSLVRSMLRGRRPSSNAESAFLTPVRGLGELVRALEDRLRPDRVRLSVAVLSVERGASGYRLWIADGTFISADAVILATPAFVTADLVRGLDIALARTLEAIPFVSTATVSLAYPARAVPHSLDGYGYVSPRAEGGPIVACSWTSSKFPARAPNDMALVRLFLGRAGFEDVVEGSDAEVLEAACEELRLTLGVTAEPALARVFRWPRGMPQYTRGHLERIAEIERRLQDHPGLFLAGASYRGIGIPDCIESGRRAAKRVIESVTSRVTG